MDAEQTSVRTAIKRGERFITYPGLLVLTLSLAGSILPLFGFPWWYALCLPSAVMILFFYTRLASFIWMGWAYRVVADVRRLQRAAAFAGFLKRDSNAIHPPYNETSDFFDDIAIPAQTQIQEHSLLFFCRKPLLTISNAGIELEEKTFFSWNEIHNERIARVGFKQTGGDGITWRSSCDYFRFETETNRYEFPCSRLWINPWELDLLLYIYRGRFSLHNSNAVKERYEALPAHSGEKEG